MPALIAATVVLGAIFASLITAFLILKFKKPSADPINAPPNTTNQVKALQKSTAEWSIPYEELQLGRLLGKGSQGEVYLASWRGTTVAVKKVDVEKVDPEIIGEFCMEAEMMKRLRHPDLTLFMGVSISHPHLCIVTEYVERGSLFDLLKDATAPLTWQRCLRLALDVAQGMNYLHEFKPTPILHRDLKSLNILIDSNWRAKVADFGMTRFQQDGTMTQCGSPLWMAPEMIRNLPYDEKADVYSFGICLWELYTKKIPYRGTGLAPSVLVVKVYQEHFRPEIPIKCPLAYVRLIEQCWHPVPSKRPTFIQIIKALEGFLVDPTIMNHKPFSEREDLTIPRPISEEKKDILTARPGGNWMVSFTKEVVLDAKIGQGRSATVYRGHFRGKEVAVKQWLVNLQAVEHKKEVVERVTNIMQLISQLRHPNILLFMGAFIEERHVGMLVEHMPRGTLRDLIADQKVVLHWDTVLQFLIDVAAGMTYLHANNPPILHGDLKSSRLLVDDNWRVKISGYGIIDFASSIQSVNPSVWTAPEVLEDPMNGNAASNSYSYGMILFELVTRTAPFANEHFSTNLAQKILNGHRPVIPNSVSKPFADLIKACWNPDPIKRPTFPEILNRLTRMKEEGPPKTVLSADNSFMYHKASTVHAWKSKDAVTIVKDWGKNVGKPGCYVVLSGEDDAYLCAEDVFHQTYQRVGHSSNEYRKLGTIRARRMDQPFAIKTQDGVEHGGAGDYLVQNDSGDQWCIEGSVFPTLYEVDEEQ